MQLLEQVKSKIQYLAGCDAAYLLAHAAWSACDHREFPGPSSLQCSSALDAGNNDLVCNLYCITRQADYSNTDQANMLKWLDEAGYSQYVAKQLKTTRKKLVDWE